MSRWETLLAVQDHDTHADQLRHRARTLPARADLSSVEGSLAELAARIADVEGRRHVLEREQARLEDEIDSMRLRREQANRQLYGGSTNNPRELQALQEDIGAIDRRISQLEDDELEIMEQIEPLTSEVRRLESQREDLDRRGQELRESIRADEEAIASELREVMEARESAAALVPSELWPDYDRLRARMGGVAVARLVGTTCQGCRLSLSAVEVDRIKHRPPEEAVHCEECGRLLVR